MNILALDIATITGWATKEASGVWDFHIARDESKGMRLLRFRAKVIELCQLMEINLIVYEMPAGHHKNALLVAAEMIGVLKSFCEDNNIDYRSYPSTEIKRFATGKGSANKILMIEAAREKLGYKGDDDNEADALWLYQLANHQIKEVG